MFDNWWLKSSVIYVTVLVGGLFASYGLARFGEPQSVWLWQLLGLL